VTAEDRELLAHAIWTTGRTRAVDRFPLADALMPLVEAIARRKAAEELREIVLDALIVAEVMHERGPIRVPVTYLNERADALTDYEEKGSER
jgi:hypothetical protein